MFHSTGDGKELVVDDFTPKVLFIYFRCLYQEQIKCSNKNAVELYCLTRYFGDYKLETEMRLSLIHI